MSQPNHLSQEQIWKLLEGHADILSPMVKRKQAELARHTCVLCGSSSLVAFVNPAHPFSQGEPLPNYLLKCQGCEAEFDPASGLVHRTSTTASG